MKEFDFDIAIIGAGPAGIACALGLKASGLRVAIFEKAQFPRDKICGDAIPARALRVLNELNPDSAKRLENLDWKTNTKACKVVAPSDEIYTYHFEIGGYCAKRFDFDNFLWEELKAFPQIEHHEGLAINTIRKIDQGWEIISAKQVFTTQLLIGCDGANGIVSKSATESKMDAAHHCAAVRAYYENVEGLSVDTMEIYLLKDWLPGYFWIFPVSETTCNVGYGMLSAQVAKRKLALRKALPTIISEVPALKTRFSNAKALSDVQGFGLPLGSRMVQMNGDSFLLAGDAASLIDPATGEGIGNAMWSGQIAAKWALSAFRASDFSAAFLSGYGKEIRQKMAKELRYKYWAQQLLGERQWLINWAILRANRPGLVAWLIKKVF